MVPYIDDWKPLLPHERFQPPAEFSGLLNAVKTSPLTILVGSPAVGKTFSAMQVLWREFHDGRDIEWISARRYLITEGVVPDSVSPPDMSHRIDLLTRHLGLTTPLPPLDSTEFVAGHLKPNNTVYIEDPFGKTDDEFNISLHTYRFFDLHRFVSEITIGAARHGCRVLITSREQLFERWLREIQLKGETPPESVLIRMSADSYEYAQRFSFAQRLASLRGIADLDNASRVIANHSDVPFDVEVIVRDLPSAASIEQVKTSAGKSRGHNVNKLRERVIVDADCERPFLLLLIALNEAGRPKHNNFHEAYVHLFRILEINGDENAALADAIAKYRSILTRREVIVMEVGKKGGINFVHKNDATHYNLEPVHSTVIDAISSHLREASRIWLESVAASLSRQASGLTSRIAQTEIAYMLMRWGFGLTEERAQRGIFQAVFGGSDQQFLKIPILFTLWAKLPIAFKKEFFQRLAERDSALELDETCAWLDLLPSEDAWRVVRILAKKRGMGVSLIHLHGHPWRYFAERLDDIPPDIKVTLDDIAEKNPVLFVYALSGVLIEKWDVLPGNWRAAFLDPKVLENEHARQNLFIHIADCWKNAAPELRAVFLDNARNPKYQVRADVATAALLCHESSPNEMEGIYLATINDKVVYVPLHVMHDALGDDQHDRQFAELLFNKCGAAGAATMLSFLISRREMEAQWKVELARQCVDKGGDFSRAVLAYHCLNTSVREFFGYTLSNSPERDPEQVRLAWIWAYANSDGRRPKLSNDQVLSILDGLSGTYRYLGFQYLSVQINHLPSEMAVSLEQVAKKSVDDLKAFDEGIEDRQPPKGSRTLYGYPAIQFVQED